MSAEEWRPVLGWSGFYEVSNLGRVKSLARLDALGRLRPACVLTPEVKANGRHRVTLYGVGKSERRQVHHLVLEAFVGPRPDGLEACHWNDDPSDNSIGNLRWDTKKANSRDAVRNRTHSMSRKTHCPSGHPYDSENTYFRPVSGDRRCRTCTRDHNRAAYQRRAATREAA